MTDHSKAVGSSTAPAPLSAEEKRDLVRSTRRFDLRRLIGALFVFYGVILAVMGITPSEGDLSMTGGLNINLWTGLGMLVVGGLFFLWDRLAPVPEEDIIGNAENREQLREEGEGALAP